ncbi:MAG: bifunctional diaminohydroxyphosphoribosylaminopyrimidine deaminase/5-amino-6-(5-phosphoribosylamino)uracil reductase RibD [Deltaproteobacteria bacterium]|nr:bifunctional diaminohydroxyphosphoribosylaminopyrimidine deaminase/5-amino-6-(5-phosphoribosylamino)uracil reductase RibD [Deltaproteobacteria bacterium]
MKRALRLAVAGHPSPNPHVGAVVAKGEKLISIGYHARCGQAHAEVVAIQRARERARGATLYVTFEPCNHYGRTGPCTEAIIEAGIKRVVIGCRDMAPHKPGAIDRLRAAGIEVVLGVEEESAQKLVEDFSKYMLEGLPFVILKAAITLDGRIAGRAGDSKWITGEKARAEAHRLRARSDAVLVGVGTVLKDDPRLTVRGVRGTDPIRVILDSRLRTPPRSKIVAHDSASPTLIFHAPEVKQSRKRYLERPNVELISVPREESRGLNLRPVLQELARRGVVRLLVEGGSRVHGAFLQNGLTDRVAIFIAPRILGDARAIPMVDASAGKSLESAWRLKSIKTRKFGEDILVTGDLQKARGRCLPD